MKTFGLINTFLLTLCLTAPAFAGAQGKIVLVDEIAVEAPDIRLGDIASLQVQDDQLRERLANLVVDEAPNLGRSRLVSAYKLRALFEREGIEGVDVQGSQSIVMTAAREMKSEEVEKLVREWVLSKSDSVKTLEIDFQQLPRKFQVPAGDDVELRIKHSGRNLVGQVAVTVQAFSNGRSFASGSVRMQVKRYEEVLVMVRPLKVGEVVTAAHMERKEIEVKRSTGLEVVDQESILGLVAKRNLRIGDRPSVHDFDEPIVIKQGSHNRVIVINNGLRLAVSGAKALQDGKKGQTILFSNPMNKGEPLRAEVIRPGIALIRMN